MALKDSVSSLVCGVRIQRTRKCEHRLEIFQLSPSKRVAFCGLLVLDGLAHEPRRAFAHWT